MASSIRLPKTPSPTKAAQEWTKDLAAELKKTTGDSSRITAKQAQEMTGLFADNVKNYFEKTGRKWVKVDTLLNSAAKYAEREMKEAAGPDNKLSLKDIRLLPKDMVDDLLSMRGKPTTGGVVTKPEQPTQPAGPDINVLIDKASNSDLADYNKTFSLDRYPATDTLEDILRDVTEFDEDDMDWADLSVRFEMKDGADAVEAFVGGMQQIGADEHESRSDGDDYDLSAKDAKQLFEDMGAAARATFSPVSRFESVQLAEHMIDEDGDLEYRLLIAKEKNGGWLVLNYNDFPF